MQSGDKGSCRESLGHTERQMGSVLKMIALKADDKPAACSIEIKVWNCVTIRVNDNGFIITKHSRLVNKNCTRRAAYCAHQVPRGAPAGASRAARNRLHGCAARGDGVLFPTPQPRSIAHKNPHPSLPSPKPAKIGRFRRGDARNQAVFPSLEGTPLHFRALTKMERGRG